MEKEEAFSFPMPDAIINGKASHAKIVVFVGDGLARAEDSRVTKEGLVALIPSRAVVNDSVGHIVPFTPPAGEEIIGGGASKPAAR